MMSKLNFKQYYFNIFQNKIIIKKTTSSTTSNIESSIFIINSNDFKDKYQLLFCYQIGGLGSSQLARPSVWLKTRWLSPWKEKKEKIPVSLQSWKIFSVWERFASLLLAPPDVHLHLFINLSCYYGRIKILICWWKIPDSDCIFFYRHDFKFDFPWKFWIYEFKILWSNANYIFCLLKIK